jgi:hypothetical protein
MVALIDKYTQNLIEKIPGTQFNDIVEPGYFSLSRAVLPKPG